MKKALKQVTIVLNEQQAEALYCLLQFAVDGHEIYNNTNGLTFHDKLPSGESDADEEQDDIEAIDAARVNVAKQVWKQLPKVAKERHGLEVAPGRFKNEIA